MNHIQQISLKLRLGLDPAAKLSDEELRALWREASARKARVSESAPRNDNGGLTPRRAA